MNASGLAGYLARNGGLKLAGAATSLMVSFALFTRFGIGGTLSRDEAVYAYAGQQLAHGVPPYASIFDPKTPLASMIAGVAAAIAHITGGDDLYFIRAAFFVCACLTVLAVYLLATLLWRSVLAGVVAGIVFASFTGFAEDALSGPDAKTPAVLFAVLSMWLIIHRRWFWAGFAGSLAFLAWQPFVIYLMVAALVAAVNSSSRQRWQALGLVVTGGAVPLVLVVAYFALSGALGQFFEAAFIFPASGIKRTRETVGARVMHIVHVVHGDYKFSGALIWAGIVALLVLAVVHFVRNSGDLRQALRDPLVCVVLITLVAEAAYVMLDFQGYPDIYPFLPYAALGMGGAAAVVQLLKSSVARRAAAAGVLVTVALLTAFSWVWFSNDPANGGIRAQRGDACALERVTGPAGGLYALGNPAFLVLTHRRNPDRFIYLGSGVDLWKIRHMPGGFDGWTAQIQAADPSVIVMGGGWRTRLAQEIAKWLKDAGHSPRYLGTWRIFLTPAARALAQRHGVTLTHRPTDFVTGFSGGELPPGGCG